MKNWHSEVSPGKWKKDENYIDAIADTRVVTSFLVKVKVQVQLLTREWLPRFFSLGTQNRKRKNQKKKKKKKSKNQKIEKSKNRKIEKSKRRKKKKNLFSVVLDKMCVFCLYPIPDSQQCVKRGSCRRLILSELLCLCLFLFHIIRRISKYSVFKLCRNYLLS